MDGTASGEGRRKLLVTCACGNRLSAPAKLAGKTVHCPACGESLVIPYTQRQSTDDESRLATGDPLIAAVNDDAESSRSLPPLPPRTQRKAARTPRRSRPRDHHPNHVAWGIGACVLLLVIVGSFGWSPSPKGKQVNDPVAEAIAPTARAVEKPMAQAAPEREQPMVEEALDANPDAGAETQQRPGEAEVATAEKVQELVRRVQKIRSGLKYSDTLAWWPEEERAKPGPLQEQAAAAEKEFEKICQELEPLGDEAIDPLIAYFAKRPGNKWHNAWEAVARLLGRIDNPRAVEALVDIGIGKEIGRGACPSVALRALADQSAMEPLVARTKLGIQYAGEIEAAVYALGHIGTPEAAAVVIEVLKEATVEREKGGNDWPAAQNLQAAAIRVLRKLKDPRAAKALAHVAISNRGNQEEALEALLVIDPPVLEVLERCLEDDNLIPYDRLIAVAMARAGQPGIVRLVQIFQDSTPPNNARYAKALGEVDNPAVVPALIDALKNGDVALRTATVESLAKLGEPAAVEPICKQLRDPQITMVAIQALGQFKDPRAMDALGEVLNEGSSEQAQAAATALSHFGTHALPFYLDRNGQNLVGRGAGKIRLALVQMGEPAIKPMVNFVTTNRNLHVRGLALGVLEDLEKKGEVPGLDDAWIRILNNRGQPTADRALALRMLKGSPDPRVPNEMIKVLKADKNKKLLVAAAKFFHSRPTPPEAHGPLLKILRHEIAYVKDPYVQEDYVLAAAAKALSGNTEMVDAMADSIGVKETIAKRRTDPNGQDQWGYPMPIEVKPRSQVIDVIRSTAPDTIEAFEAMTLHHDLRIVEEAVKKLQKMKDPRALKAVEATHLKIAAVLGFKPNWTIIVSSSKDYVPGTIRPGGGVGKKLSSEKHSQIDDTKEHLARAKSLLAACETALATMR